MSEVDFAVFLIQLVIVGVGVMLGKAVDERLVLLELVLQTLDFLSVLFCCDFVVAQLFFQQVVFGLVVFFSAVL